MEESRFYQKILHMGEVQEARKFALLIGRARFGEPAPEVVAALETETDLTRLEEFVMRAYRVSSWQEVLDLNG